MVKRNIEAATAGAYVRRLRAIGVECGTKPEYLDLQPQPIPAAVMSDSPAAKKSTETIEKRVVTKNPSVSAACWIISVVGIIFLVIAFPIGIALLMVSGLLGWLWEKKKVVVLEGACPNCSSRITLGRDLQGAGCPICQKPFVSRNGKFQAV